jgi:serine carboxypeptidase 1
MAAASQEGGFKGLMDTVIRKKLGIIPKDVSYVITIFLHFQQLPLLSSSIIILTVLLRCCRWGDQSGDVFDAMAGDFMKPRIQEVDQLLKMGVNVTIYSGQVNLITPLIIWGLSILKLMIGGTTKEGSGELEKQPKTQTYTHLTLI